MSYRTKFHSLYREEGFYAGENSPCYYCGQLATCKDHSFPLAYLDNLTNAFCEIPYEELIILPSCSECNSILSDKVFENLDKRKKYIKSQLRKRYKRLLNTPDWDEEEFDDMAPQMVEEIKSQIVKRNHLRMRLGY